ncbi:hypothetical protein NC652_007004 [Populus alba x Populus x berolinensis]|nr:hypothetical protein NC652_007004 [Populus alba x Populus x berolinensis]
MSVKWICKERFSRKDVGRERERQRPRKMKHQRRKGVELIYGVAFKRDKSTIRSGNELPVQPECIHTSHQRGPQK